MIEAKPFIKNLFSDRHKQNAHNIVKLIQYLILFRIQCYDYYNFLSLNIIVGIMK